MSFNVILLFINVLVLLFINVKGDFLYYSPVYWQKLYKLITKGKLEAFFTIKLVAPCSVFQTTNLSHAYYARNLKQ